MDKCISAYADPIFIIKKKIKMEYGSTHLNQRKACGICNSSSTLFTLHSFLL